MWHCGHVWCACNSSQQHIVQRSLSACSQLVHPPEWLRNVLRWNSVRYPRHTDAMQHHLPSVSVNAAAWACNALPSLLHKHDAPRTSSIAAQYVRIHCCAKVVQNGAPLAHNTRCIQHLQPRPAQPHHTSSGHGRRIRAPAWHPPGKPQRSLAAWHPSSKEALVLPRGCRPVAELAQRAGCPGLSMAADLTAPTVTVATGEAGSPQGLSPTPADTVVHVQACHVVVRHMINWIKAPTIMSPSAAWRARSTITGCWPRWIH
jgi:hypothetical protein